MADAALSNPKEAERRRKARQTYQQREAKRVRQLVTPEGAALNLKIASGGERAGAFLLDFTLQIIAIIALAFLASFIASGFGWDGQRMAFALIGLLIFGVRNFYFIGFELSRKAATPGKRAIGLRVAARDGGRLTANAVIARNFMRELEVFLPFQAALGFGFGGGGVSGWINLLILLWCLIFLLFPLFNRDKLRIGDLVAGTMVIHAPKVKLLADVASSTPRINKTAFDFTPAQLDIYGVHELHVLEDVLRQSTDEIKRNVAGRIAQKIGWTPQTGDTDTAFLEAFYANLRARLEQGMLFGQKKTDKFDRS
jgi:uncharacterized RDD family membrane protein YckC